MTEQCRRVELVLSDVDGVLTDGGIFFDNQGIEIKKFHIRDGLGIKLWQKAGFKFGVLTARASHIVKVRAAELGIELVRQGFETKMPVALEILKSFNLKPEQCCYIGDDLTDLPVIRQVGLGIAVAALLVSVLASYSMTFPVLGLMLGLTLIEVVRLPRSAGAHVTSS